MSKKTTPKPSKTVVKKTVTHDPPKDEGTVSTDAPKPETEH